MQAIVAVDENWGIGYNDELLCKIPGLSFKRRNRESDQNR